MCSNVKPHLHLISSEEITTLAQNLAMIGLCVIDQIGAVFEVAIALIKFTNVKPIRVGLLHLEQPLTVQNGASWVIIEDFFRKCKRRVLSRWKILFSKRICLHPLPAVWWRVSCVSHLVVRAGNLNLLKVKRGS